MSKQAAPSTITTAKPHCKPNPCVYRNSPHQHFGLRKHLGFAFAFALSPFFGAGAKPDRGEGLAADPARGLKSHFHIYKGLQNFVSWTSRLLGIGVPEGTLS
jgi:hypothetical protein